MGRMRTSRMGTKEGGERGRRRGGGGGREGRMGEINGIGRNGKNFERERERPGRGKWHQ